MNNDTDTLQQIFHRTDGHCHLTGAKLAFKHYGKVGMPGAWEIEHSVPQSKGGTDHLNNLYAASISANRAKGNSSTRTARAQYGLSYAPLSQQRKAELRESNAWAGLGWGALIGLPFGPLGVGLLAALGAVIGSDREVK